MCLHIDGERAQAFAGQVISMYNQAMLGLMTSIGHKSGLFDTMATLPAASSDEIARAEGLQERYVREWLAAMVTGKIIDYDGVAHTYALPDEHAAVLTRAAGTDNLAAMYQFIACFGAVEQQVADCVRAGGGVPYSAYETFQRVMAEQSALVHDAQLIDAILPLVDGLPQRLSAGLDLLDIGCGQGHAVNLIARAYPRTRARGYDLSEVAIGVAEAEAQALGLSNASFRVCDVARIEDEAAFDVITAFDAIHDQVDPVGALRAVYRALRHDGVFLCVDIAASSSLADNLHHPLAPALYTTSTMHCMTVSLAHGGKGLGTMWGEELARQMLAEAGFSDIRVERVDGDIVNNYYIARK